MGAQSDVAEDLVQETFLTAFRIPGAKAEREVRGQAAWLRGIARNLFLQHCRRHRRQQMPAERGYLEQAEATWESDFLRGSDGFDYVEALRECLDALPEKERSAVDLRYAQEKSRADMAQVLKMTEDGVKSLLQRIRATLAECIRRRLALQERLG